MLAAALPLLLFALTVAPTDDNPIYRELRERGIKMSDGTTFRLPPPIMANGLDATGQSAALGKVADAHNPVQELVRKSYYAPVITKVRTLKPAKGEGPAVRAVDVWFVAHGKWKTLLSKDFLESTAGAESSKSQVVTRSGFLSEEELRKRKLSAVVKDGREERFSYTTFSLFERVEISATRFSVLVRDDDSLLAAGKLDPRFDKDATYPNAWRPLLRDAQAEIQRGPAQAFSHAAGYAKITRLQEPADAVFVESHIIYEEPYGWFDGVNLVKQKVPPMVQEKVRSFRRKLAMASEEKQAK
jgi:hypothetical protein